MSKKQFYVICTFLVIIIGMLAYSIQQNNEILKTNFNYTKYIVDILERMSQRVIMILEYAKELAQ